MVLSTHTSTCGILGTSIVCQEDVYLKELVRYIHLNPLRAKLVSDMEGLIRYKYADTVFLWEKGHVIGRKQNTFFPILDRAN